MKVNLEKFEQDIKIAQKNIIKDIQKYTFTTFKRVFTNKTILKANDLQGQDFKAFEERMKLNKRTGGKQTVKYKKGSDPGQPPRQDPRKYLSNNVRYIDSDTSAIVILNVPFGKTLDEGGTITTKQFKTPFDWMRLDKLIYNGVTYFGRVLKTTKYGSIGMKISQNTRQQYTTKKAKITWFSKQKSIVQKYDYLKVNKSKTIKARPFLDKVLNSVVKSGFIQSTISNRLSKIKI